MREILFRGKRIDNEEWMYGSSPIKVTSHDGKLKDMMYASKHEIGFELHAIDPDTVGAYTGLKDKNGVKVFEGDICKDSMGRTFTVEWDDDNARFIGYTTDTWDINTEKYVQGEKRICYISRYPKVEVITNIHDKEGE